MIVPLVFKNTGTEFKEYCYSVLFTVVFGRAGVVEYHKIFSKRCTKNISLGYC